MSRRLAHDFLREALAAADIPAVLACQGEIACKGMLCGGMDPGHRPGTARLQRGRSAARRAGNIRGLTGV